MLLERFVSKVTKAYRVSVPERMQPLGVSQEWTLPEVVRSGSDLHTGKRESGTLRDFGPDMAPGCWCFQSIYSIWSGCGGGSGMPGVPYWVLPAPKTQHKVHWYDVGGETVGAFPGRKIDIFAFPAWQRGSGNWLLSSGLVRIWHQDAGFSEAYIPSCQGVDGLLACLVSPTESSPVPYIQHFIL